jgi:molybdopterin synthase sulfur carrier subunit
MATVTYWAGAARAAGLRSESIDAPTLSVLRRTLSQRPALFAVMATASLLVDGHRFGDDDPLPADAAVDVLPPFAGG